MNKVYRIAKLIARLGFCSRREAEKLVISGRVTVNDNIISNLSSKFLQNANIKIDNKKLDKFTPTKIWSYHKKPGFVTSHYSKEHRTIFDDLENNYAKLKTIGRLDKNTEGLLLLTNDGDYARRLELPKNYFLRVYKVQIFGKLEQKNLDKFKTNFTLDGINYKPVVIKIISQTLNNAWLRFEISEGKNREIRKILAWLNVKVKRLIRESYGPYKLGNLKKGQIIEVKKLC